MRRRSLLPRALPLLVATLGSLAGCMAKPMLMMGDQPESRPARLDAMYSVQRLYQLGEVHFARGDYAGAVGLWRQTFLLLPPSEEGDRLRHALMQRMGYGLLSAYQADHDRTHLEWGQRVLERYLAKHEELFGDEDEARQARAPIYDLLGDIELRMDEEDEGMAEIAAAEEVEVHEEVEEAFDEALGQDASELRDVHAGEVVDADGVERDVVVKDSPFATGKERRVQVFLRHPGFMGPSLFDKPGDPLNPTRPLVRAGIARAQDRGVSSNASVKDRRLAQRYLTQLVRENREALEECYGDVLLREPLIAARVHVAVELGEAGEVDVRLAGGHLGDAHGDACIYWALVRGSVAAAAPELGDSVGVKLPVTFFIQPQRTVEGTASPLGDGPSMGDALREYQIDRHRDNYQDLGAVGGLPSE